MTHRLFWPVWLLAAVTTGLVAGFMLGHALILGRFLDWMLTGDPRLLATTYPAFARSAGSTGLTLFYAISVCRSSRPRRSWRWPSARGGTVWGRASPRSRPWPGRCSTMLRASVPSRPSRCAVRRRCPAMWPPAFWPGTFPYTPDTPGCCWSDWWRCWRYRCRPHAAPRRPENASGSRQRRPRNDLARAISGRVVSALLDRATTFSKYPAALDRSPPASAACAAPARAR